MRKFSKEESKRILQNEISPEELSQKYVEYSNEVLDEVAKLGKEVSSDNIINLINKYKRKSNLALTKINESNENQKTIDAYLPEIIKARLFLYLINQLNILSKTNKETGKVKFNFWDGYILQKLLFKRDLERKPVSDFWFKLLWKFITNKKILMTLVNEKGIYCFYSKKLLSKIKNIVNNAYCVEVAAGDGTLTGFLNNTGVKCIATDDYSWSNYINYNNSVEKLSAKEALNKYRPEVVICSWSPPNNNFEKYIFQSDHVNTYIAIGTRNGEFSGNHGVYESQTKFTMELDEELSAMIIPPSLENAVYIFKRK